MKTFGEFIDETILLEAFDIGPRPMKSSPKLNKQNMIDHYSVDYDTKEANIIVNNIYKQYDEVKTFLVNINVQYIIIVLRKGNDTEIHFNIFGKPDDISDVNNNNNPTGIFQKIFDIIYWECMRNGRKIIIEFPKSRLEFYKRLIDKVLTKHNLQYTINITSKALILKPPKNYKLEKMQEFYKF